jgi:FMN reductase [NAD(P)H]
MVYAAADTAPTAGGFQGFEIYHVKRDEIKVELVEAANKQPYVNAPVVLVFCMNPERIKMNFPPTILRKFSLQDATLAAAYAQLAAHALGLSSIWIGMIDEEKIMSILNTKYVPSSILCLGYPQKLLQPKPKRNLMGLIHEV